MQCGVLKQRSPPAASQENVADLLRGTPRLNVPIRRTVFGVSGPCRVAVIGLKPIDRAPNDHELDDRRHVTKWRLQHWPLLTMLQSPFSDMAAVIKLVI